MKIKILKVKGRVHYCEQGGVLYKRVDYDGPLRKMEDYEALYLFGRKADAVGDLEQDPSVPVKVEVNLERSYYEEPKEEPIQEVRKGKRGRAAGYGKSVRSWQRAMKAEGMNSSSGRPPKAIGVEEIELLRSYSDMPVKAYCEMRGISVRRYYEILKLMRAKS